MTRRERKRLDTRAAIAGAALDLFEEQGYVATTIDEIAERADVARRTFFRYFPSKEAVLLPHPSEYEEEFLVVLDRVPRPLTVRRLLDGLAEAASAIDDEAEVHRRRSAVLTANQDHLLTSAVTAFVDTRDAVVAHLADSDGLAPDDPRLHLAVGLGLFVIAQAYVRWSIAGDGATLADEFRRTVDTLYDLVADDQPITSERPSP